jgi:exosortase E/protease (VPEID-CTERM system)
MPVVRWAGLAALLVAELIALTLRFDTGKLEGQHQWWAELLGQTPLIPQIAIVVATALLLFGGRWLREEVARVSGDLSAPHVVWPYLGAHFLAFAGLVKLTAYVLEGDISSSACPGAWVLAWLALCLLTLAFWIAAALPPTLWGPLLRSGSGVLASAVAIGLAAWGAGRITSELWRPLGQWTLEIVHGMLRMAGQDTVYEPAQFVVGTTSFLVSITPLCSGYEGIGLIWVFLALYLWMFRDDLRFPQSLLLLPIGTAVAWLGNSVRITALILIGTWFSPKVAGGGFHSQAGWLAFNAIALGLIAVTQRLTFFTRSKRYRAGTDVSNPAVAYLAPFLALVAATMVTRALSDEFDYLYPLRVLAVAGAFWFCRNEYRSLQFSWSMSGVGFGALVGMLWLLFGILSPDHNSATAQAAGLAATPPAGRLFWVFFRVLGYVVLVPLAEELAFRGYLTRRLISTDFDEVPLGRFTWFSFLASSAIFGLLHPRWFVAGMLAGMIFALALYRRGTIWDAVVAHATANGLIAVYVLTTGDWSMWG